jgi:hypothetical protein
VADRNDIVLTEGRKTTGRHRRSAEQEAAVIEARRKHPDAPQIEITQQA